MMTITTLKPYKGSTWILELSNGETYFLAGEIVSQFHLHQDHLISSAQLAEVLEAELARKAFQRSLYLLDNREYGYQELFQKLEKTYPETVCFTVLDKLVRLNLVNDLRYAEMLARHYVEVKRFGLRRAQFAMREKGLSREIITEALEDYEDQMPEQCYTVMIKKYGRILTDPDDRKTIEKVKAGLFRLGYDYADVRAAIDYYFEEDE